MGLHQIETHTIFIKGSKQKIIVWLTLLHILIYKHKKESQKAEQYVTSPQNTNINVPKKKKAKTKKP